MLAAEREARQGQTNPAVTAERRLAGTAMKNDRAREAQQPAENMASREEMVDREAASLHQRYRAVIVAVAVVLVVKVTVHDVVDVIAVRNRLVPATGAVNVPRLMPGADMPTGAGSRIRRCHGQGVFLHGAVGPHVVQMAVVNVVHMIAVLNSGVPASRPVLVVVVRATHRFVSVCELGNPTG
jgi:hypothetical protein